MGSDLSAVNTPKEPSPLCVFCHESPKSARLCVKDYGHVSVLLEAKSFRKRCSSLGCKALLYRGHTDKTVGINTENVCKILWMAKLMRIEAVLVQKQRDSTAVPIGGWKTCDT